MASREYVRKKPNLGKSLFSGMSLPVPHFLTGLLRSSEILKLAPLLAYCNVESKVAANIITRVSILLSIIPI